MMKRHNEKLIVASRKLSADALRRSKQTVKKMAHPSKNVDQVGSRIGRTMGIGLILTGATGLFIGSGAWAVGSIAAGSATIISSVVRQKRQQK
ncbi:hypothetical protein NIE88_02145 [Sporolactobacillus shoreicorticis]|uniref:Uncharacterized protein n=1 Tax=Sporolactobacillus shoreicorticis TaxID=1923877 RepID=A0ABW5S0J9_9BACL|nr:hypothetical protein [Sporolactobacillus shoreicorticis]MCO7124580.1 hypothetical protein [Sporolactobacillus shoreicorticis]